MSDQAKQAIAAQRFKAADEAIRKGNFDYAVELFLTCAKLIPDNLRYRQALRVAEYKMYADNKKGAAMAKTRSQGPRLRMQLARTRKKWHDLMDAAEDALTLNPWETMVLTELATACKELKYYDQAVWILKEAINNDAKNIPLYRLLGEVYELSEQFNLAANIWERVRQMDPKDEVAQHKSHALAASATIQKGKYEKDAARGALNSSSKDTDPAERTPTEDSKVKGPESAETRLRRDIAALEEKLKDDPKSVDLLEQIGEYYYRLDDYDNAAKYYQLGIEASGGQNDELMGRLMNCRLEPLKRRLEKIDDAKSKWDKTAPDAMAKAAKIKAMFNETNNELIKREIEYYRFKVKQRIDDYESQFELGYRLLKTNQFEDAIKALQQSRNDMRKKPDSLLWLGVAFWKKKNFALAEKNLADALAAVPSSDNESKKRVLYYRGCVAQERNEIAAAIEFFNDIAVLDYGYRDVAKRLDELQSQPPPPAAPAS